MIGGSAVPKANQGASPTPHPGADFLFMTHVSTADSSTDAQIRGGL